MGSISAQLALPRRDAYMIVAPFVEDRVEAIRSGVLANIARQGD
jgi:hypothetical protein